MVDSSLDDIKRALFPSFSPLEIARLDSNTTLVRDVHGVSYLPGMYACTYAHMHAMHTHL